MTKSRLQIDYAPSGSKIHRWAYPKPVSQRDPDEIGFMARWVYHRENGPAFIVFDPRNEELIDHEAWFIDGIRVAKNRDEWYEFLKLNDLPKEDLITLKMMR